MSHTLRFPLRLLVIAVPAMLPLSARPASVSDACAGAGTATNAVVRFYLAIDRRQYAAAYRCLTPPMQAALPFASYVAGYAHTVVSRLVFADDQVPNGSRVDHVAVELRAVDAAGGRLIATIFAGRWIVNAAGRLTQGLIHVATQRVVAAVPHTDVARVLAADGRVVLAHLRADVTGDGVPDDLYVTSGAGCGSCHAQQIWVYSLGRLVFQQQVDDAEIRTASNHAGLEVRTDTPGSPGLDSCCPTERTYEEWAWGPYGFTLRGQRVVRVR